MFSLTLPTLLTLIFIVDEEMIFTIAIGEQPTFQSFVLSLVPYFYLLTIGSIYVGDSLNVGDLPDRFLLLILSPLGDSTSLIMPHVGNILY